MDRLNRFQADNYGSINRCAGLFQDARDPKRLILVFREGRDAVGDNNRITNGVAQGSCDIRANHRVEKIGHKCAFGHRNPTPLPVLVAFEKRGRCAHDPELTMTVTQRDRNNPIHFGTCRDVLIAFPGNVVGGVTDAEN